MALVSVVCGMTQWASCRSFVIFSSLQLFHHHHYSTARMLHRPLFALSSWPLLALSFSALPLAAAAAATTAAQPHTHLLRSPYAPRLSLRPRLIHTSPSPLLHPMGSNSSTASAFPKGKSDSEWRAQLSPEQFRILRQKGTEMAGTGEFDKHYPSAGVYTCAGCNSPLYKADTKFKSGCGWPAFFDAIPGAIDRHVDSTFGMKRIEITCKACGGHLGHVFQGEGFPTPTDERHCVNSVSLNL